MAGRSHHLAGYLIALFLTLCVRFLLQLVLVLCCTAAFLALSGFVQILLELIGSCHFIGYISGNGTLNVVELAEALLRDHTLSVQFILPLSSGGLALLHHLVLREDVGLARDLRGWSTLVRRVGLLELLEGARLQSTACGSAMIVLTGGVLVEPVANALAESVDASVARRLRFLVADTFVIAVRVVGFRTWRQLDRATLRRHLTLTAAGGCRTLANVGAASLRNSIILVRSTTCVGPLGHAGEGARVCGTAACEHWVTHSLLATIGNEMLGREGAGTLARAAC